MKISVITVTFNAASTLEEHWKASKSRLFHLEHVIVDGKSKDNTVALIQQFAHERMIWLSEPDKGLYDAMNKAASMASGDYLCFLNAGDTFHTSNSIEKMMSSLEEGKEPDIIYGETAIVDNHGVFLHMRRLSAPEKLSWKSFKQGMLVCHQAFIVKRELFEPYDLSYRFSADFDWCIRMMKKAEYLHNSHLTLINYLNEGMTTSNRTSSLKERYCIMVKYYGQLSTLLHHIWFVIRVVLK